MLDFISRMTGFSKLQGKVHRFISDVGDEFDSVAGEWTETARKRLSERRYPPERPRQTYVRTGQLAARWTVKKQSRNVYAISNEARSPRGKLYAPYVVGDSDGKGQAWMHRGRWWIARDVVAEEAKPGMIKSLLISARRAWNK